MPDLSRPYDVVFPAEAKFWSPETRALFIERVCIWSDGADVTDKILTDARLAAWKDGGEWNKP